MKCEDAKAAVNKIESETQDALRKARLLDVGDSWVLMCRSRGCNARRGCSLGSS